MLVLSAPVLESAAGDVCCAFAAAAVGPKKNSSCATAEMGKDALGRLPHFGSRDALRLVLQGRYKLSKLIKAIKTLESSVPRLPKA